MPDRWFLLAAAYAFHAVILRYLAKALLMDVQQW
jgi:hypothetical protein